MTEAELVLAQVRDQVLYVTINRPEKRNALARRVLDAMADCFRAHAGRPDLKAAVLTGAGTKSFAAGGDLKELEPLKTATEAAAMAGHARRALDQVRRFPVPVVAALNGDALGGGAELAIAADFRVAAAGARIGFVQGRLNIATAWGGGLDLMALVGPNRGLAILCRAELLDAEAARALGLIDAVAAEDLAAAVERFLAPIRRQAPQVLRAFKGVALNARLGRDRGEAEDVETRLFSAAWIHDDHWRAAARILAPSKG